MSQLATLPALILPIPAADKWQREQQAFRSLLEQLLKTHKGQYVAVHDEKVVEAGSDKIDVARKAYARFGYVPIFVSLVTDQPQRPVRIPSPRNLGSE